jgi:serine/threonine protein kinase
MDSPSDKPSRNALAPRLRLDRYEIKAPLGAGGMGEVYQARDFLMTWLKGEPQFDSIRADLRFVDLVRRIGLL